MSFQSVRCVVVVWLRCQQSLLLLLPLLLLYMTGTYTACKFNSSTVHVTAAVTAAVTSAASVSAAAAVTAVADATAAAISYDSCAAAALCLQRCTEHCYTEPLPNSQLLKQLLKTAVTQSSQA
jgi:guanyl-specific ribonuclease Sa